MTNGTVWFEGVFRHRGRWVWVTVSIIWEKNYWGPDPDEG